LILKAPRGAFIFCGPYFEYQALTMVAPLREKLIALTEPLLGQLGYELVDLEYVPGRARGLLPAHFQRFVGERVYVELRNPRDGRRRYTGQLTALRDEGIELNVDGAMVAVSFAELGRARLAPLWS
jgi:ribosome maturation factor RimP